MARARLFKPSFFTNARLSEVPAHGRLLFISLWTLADREGRLRDEPRVIKGATFPFENVNVDRLLAQLADAGFIQRYEASGEKVIQIANFKKHQRPHQNEPGSGLPPMYEVGVAGGQPMAMPTSSGSYSGSKSSSGSKSEGGEGAGDPPPEAPPSHPFAFTYAKRYQQSHAGRPPPQTEHAAALALEREYGADACIQLGNDLDWQKHPNYMRPILEERRDGKPKLQAVGGAAGRSTGGGDVAQQWADLAAERKRALEG